MLEAIKALVAQRTADAHRLATLACSGDGLMEGSGGS